VLLCGRSKSPFPFGQPSRFRIKFILNGNIPGTFCMCCNQTDCWVTASHPLGGRTISIAVLSAWPYQSSGYLRSLRRVGRQLYWRVTFTLSRNIPQAGICGYLKYFTLFYTLVRHVVVRHTRITSLWAVAILRRFQSRRSALLAHLVVSYCSRMSSRAFEWKG
jgi:hypothetical protein